MERCFMILEPMKRGIPQLDINWMCLGLIRQNLVSYFMSVARMEIKADEIKAGEYSVAVYHDAMIMGKWIPAYLLFRPRKYGFSNNAKGFMGAPSFENSKIGFPEQRVVRIHLH